MKGKTTWMVAMLLAATVLVILLFQLDANNLSLQNNKTLYLGLIVVAAILINSVYNWRKQ